MVEKEVCHVVYNGMPLLKSIRDFNISLPPFPDESLFLRKYAKFWNHDINYYLNLLWMEMDLLQFSVFQRFITGIKRRNA